MSYLRVFLCLSHFQFLTDTKAPPNQLRITDSLQGFEEKWNELITSFTSAGIPLNALENLNVRQWISKYVPGSKLPSVRTLRRNLVTSVAIKLTKNKKSVIMYNPLAHLTHSHSYN
jgi:hypothetical protein